MTTTAKNNAPLFTGKGKKAREEAFGRISVGAFTESKSRGDLIKDIEKALGNNPSPVLLKAVQREAVIGRIAERMPANAFNAKVHAKTMESRIAAVTVLMDYATPTANTTGAKQGRRTPTQHKAIRAADGWWCKVKAELGHSNAQTQAEANAKKAEDKRAPHHNSKAKDATPTHSELVKADAPVDKDAICAHIETQAAQLLAFVQSKKNAALCPAGYGQAVVAFHAKIAGERAARQEANNKADADKAAKSK